MNIIWTRQALHTLESIADYILRNNAVEILEIFHTSRRFPADL
jgi:plasmid stabilization system protein ParE